VSTNSTFSLRAFSITCSDVRLDDMLALSEELLCFGRGVEGTVVLGGMAWACLVAEARMSMLE